jgi:Tfp pilus assembly protein FimT
MPCRHDQMLPVICRILASLSHCWFGCLARRGWNLSTWRKIHWSDKSRFLLHVTDGRMRVWRHTNTAYTRYPKEADFRRFLTDLVDGRLLSSQCCLSTGMGANGIRLTKRCNALSSRSDVTRDLPDLGKSFTLAWCLARRGWNLRTWRKIQLSDENRFLFHVTDGRMRVWRHKNTAYTRYPKEHPANCPFQFQADGWLRNRSHGFTLKVGGYCS